MAKKADKSEYDENGRWIQERNRIKGAIRRVFRLFPQMKDVLSAARVELPPALKKNGEPGKRNQIRFKCAECGGLFSRKNVQVDHIEPVVPLHKTEADMTYDEIVRGICCNKENLQVVCSTPLKRSGGIPSCHKKKTDEENFIRKKLVERIGKEIELDPMAKNTIEEFGTSINGFHMGTIIKNLKEDFKKHLEEKERKRLEKEERKRLREEKKKKKSKS